MHTDDVKRLPGPPFSGPPGDHFEPGERLVVGNASADSKRPLRADSADTGEPTSGPVETARKSGRAMAIAAAFLGVASLLVNAVSLAFGLVPTPLTPDWLAAAAAVVLGIIAYRRSESKSTDWYLAITGMITGAAVVTFPVSVVWLFAAIVGMPFWFWHRSRVGWRWWAASTAVGLGALVMSYFAVMFLVLIIGTGDPGYNIPRWTGISEDLLAYIALSLIALIASGITGLLVTRRLKSAAIVVVVSVLSFTAYWYVVVLPAVGGDADAVMQTWMLLGTGLAIIGSALIAARFLRPGTESTMTPE